MSAATKLPPAEPHHRDRRKRQHANTTINVNRISQEERRHLQVLYPDDGHELPARRGDCKGGPRPCPFVSCKYHLYLDVDETCGSIKLNFPDLEVEDMPVSCALDVADEGGVILERVGELMNVTRARIQQVEERALRRANFQRFGRRWIDE